MLCLDGNVLRQDEQMCRDKIFRILEQLFLGQRVREVRDRACADQSKADPPNAFNRRVGALQKYADLKDLMNPVLVHGAFRLPVLVVIVVLQWRSERECLHQGSVLRAAQLRSSAAHRRPRIALASRAARSVATPSWPCGKAGAYRCRDDVRITLG